MEPIAFEFKKVKLIFHPNTLNGFYYTPVIFGEMSQSYMYDEESVSMFGHPDVDSYVDMFETYYEEYGSYMRHILMNIGVAQLYYQDKLCITN